VWLIYSTAISLSITPQHILFVPSWHNLKNSAAAVTFTRLYEQTLPLHRYCVTGVSNAEDTLQFVTPQFSPNQFFHSVQPLSNSLHNFVASCTLTVPSPHTSHPALSLCHRHTPLTLCHHHTPLTLHSHCAITTHLSPCTLTVPSPHTSTNWQ
jgi:hypothetical protein